MAASTVSSNVIAYFDETAKTVEIYPQGKSNRIGRFDAASLSAARYGLKRRGYRVTGTGDYPYGVTLNGAPTA